MRIQGNSAFAFAAAFAFHYSSAPASAGRENPETRRNTWDGGGISGFFWGAVSAPQKILCYKMVSTVPRRVGQM